MMSDRELNVHCLNMHVLNFIGSLVSKSNNTCNNGTPDDQQGQENAETSVKTSSQKPHSLQTNPDSACGNARLPNSKQPNATRQQSHRQTAYPEGNTTVLYERDGNGNIGTQDIEVDSGPITSNLSLVEDAVPATPIACIPPHIGKHLPLTYICCFSLLFDFKTQKNTGITEKLLEKVQ